MGYEVYVSLDRETWAAPPWMRGSWDDTAATKIEVRSNGQRGRYLKLEYSDVFGDLPRSVGAVARWLGVDDDFDCNTVPVKKQAVLPLEQSIENFHEVARALAGTRFADLLEDEAF